MEQSIIAVANNLKVLREYLLDKGNKAADNLSESVGLVGDYRTLLETIYCRIILLNRRRPGEVQRLLVTTYEKNSINQNQTYEEFAEAVSPTEKILMGRFKRVVIRGKRGRGVPVLFSTDVQAHIRILLQYRSQFLKANNPFLFANLNSTESICGYKVLRNYARAAEVKNPDGITCTKLRKHLATLSQVFALSENDLEQLARFMGHTIGVHRQSYRLPDDVFKLPKSQKYCY